MLRQYCCMIDPLTNTCKTRSKIDPFSWLVFESLVFNIKLLL